MSKDCNLLFIDIFIFVVIIVLLLFLLKTAYCFSVLFCKPKDYNIVVDTIKSEGIALLIGKSGSGKTTMASFIAKAEFKEYTITYMKPKETNLPKVNTEKILILWDDCLGVWNTTNRIDDRMFEALIRLIQLVKDNSEKMKAIVCIDSSSVDENQLNKLKDDVFCLNLDKSYESQLKKELFRNFLNLKIPVVRVSADVGFPLLVHLIKIGFCAQEESSSSRLLEEPVAYIRDDIDSILVKQSEDYVTLIYAISNSSTIHLKKTNRKLLDKIQRECDRIVHRKTDDTHPSSDSEAEENTTEGTCEKADHNRNINNDSTEGSREEVGSEGSENLKLNNRTSFFDKIQVKGTEKGNVTKHMKIYITDNLLRYLVVSDETSVYKFRHRFLAECILRYHIEHVGRETVLMEGPEEVRTAVEHLSEIYQEESNNTSC